MNKINILVGILGLLFFVIGLITGIYSMAFAVLFLAAGFIIAGDNPFGNRIDPNISKARKITGMIFKSLGLLVLVFTLVIRILY